MSSAPLLATPRWTVEAAGADALDEIMAVMDEAFEPCFGESWTRSQCAGILPLAGVSLLVARPDPTGAVEGFALMRCVADESELLLLAVRRGARRRGVGRALIETFERRGRAFGAGQLHLEVRASNPAVHFYHASGFTAAGRRRGYYHGRDGSEHDALTLVKRAAFDEDGQ